jgi:hypothetical protein
MDFSALPSDAALAATVEALAKNGFEAIVVPDRAAALAKALELIPPGAEVMTMSSVTGNEIGLFKELNESGRYKPVRDAFKTMDPKTQGRQMRAMAATPEWSVGSVHAITEDGHLLMASQSGSQMPAHVQGAERVLFVAGAQKVVKDTEEGMRRIKEYTLPLENVRAMQAYGKPSAINNLLIMNAQRPGRVTIIIIKEKIGF